MDIQTFFAMQRTRVSQVDGSEADRALRKARFGRQGLPEKSGAPEPYTVTRLHYDAVKAGYRSLRMLYE